MRQSFRAIMIVNQSMLRRLAKRVMLKNKIEIYNNQDEVTKRIHELKQTGYHDTDMYVIAKGEHRVDNIKGRLETLADESKSTDVSLWDKFRNLVGAQEEFENAFTRLGVEDDEIEIFTNAIESGKLLLIIANDEL